MTTKVSTLRGWEPSPLPVVHRVLQQSHRLVLRAGPPVQAAVPSPQRGPPSHCPQQRSEVPPPRPSTPAWQWLFPSSSKCISLPLDKRKNFYEPYFSLLPFTTELPRRLTVRLCLLHPLTDFFAPKALVTCTSEGMRPPTLRS